MAYRLSEESQQLLSELAEARRATKTKTIALALEALKAAPATEAQIELAIGECRHMRYRLHALAGELDKCKRRKGPGLSCVWCVVQLIESIIGFLLAAATKRQKDGQ